MKKHSPKISISRLREIGWPLWDPIGLSDASGGWRGEPFEDEYDSYLLKAAGMLRNGSSVDEVAGFLFTIETKHMGLGLAEDEADHRAKLSNLVHAIATDKLVWSDGHTVNQKSAASNDREV